MAINGVLCGVWLVLRTLYRRGICFVFHGRYWHEVEPKALLPYLYQCRRCKQWWWRGE